MERNGIAAVLIIYPSIRWRWTIGFTPWLLYLWG